MIERRILKRFLGKTIGLLYRDTNRDVFIRGTLVEITENTVVIHTNFKEVALEINSIVKVKGDLSFPFDE